MQRKVVMFVAGTSQSFSIVGNPLFRALLPDDFIPPSQIFFTNVSLPTAYENTKAKLLYDISIRSFKYVGLQLHPEPSYYAIE